MQNLPSLTNDLSLQPSEVIFRPEGHKPDLGVQVVLEGQILSHHRVLRYVCFLYSSLLNGSVYPKYFTPVLPSSPQPSGVLNKTNILHYPGHSLF